MYLTHFIDRPDFTWHSYSAYLWSIIEVGLGATVACVPTLRTLFSALPIIKKTLSNYSYGYPRKFQRDPEQYSNISNGEIPLQLYTGQELTAATRKDSARLEMGTFTAAAAGTDSPYSNLADQVSCEQALIMHVDVNLYSKEKSIKN